MLDVTSTQSDSFNVLLNSVFIDKEIRSMQKEKSKINHNASD